MPIRLELELVGPGHAFGVLVQLPIAPAGENAGNLADVLVGVAGVHADGRQFQHLTRIVFVQVVGAVIVVVQKLRHQRAARRIQQHVPEIAQRIFAEELPVVDVLRGDVGVLGRGVEMVCPEMAHDLLQLLLAEGRMRDVIGHQAAEQPALILGGRIQQILDIHRVEGLVGNGVGVQLLFDIGRETDRAQPGIKFGRGAKGQAAKRLGHPILRRQSRQRIADRLGRDLVRRAGGAGQRDGDRPAGGEILGKQAHGELAGHRADIDGRRAV